MKAAGWISLTVSFALAPAGALAVGDPTVQWVFPTRSRLGDYLNPARAPLVVQLTDDNGNGRIDANDSPDVVFTSQLVGQSQKPALIVAVDGASGATLFVLGNGASEFPVANGSLAAGDLDGDGTVELVAIYTNYRQLVAYEHTGMLMWVGELLPELPYWFSASDRVAIADLDQDGVPEIYVGATVFNANGRVLWRGTAGQGLILGQPQRASSAVDLDPASPGLEILAGNTLYSAKGDILWSNGTVDDGLTAVGDFDGDGLPEIALITATFDPWVPAAVRMLSALDGTVLGPPHVMPPPEDSPYPSQEDPAQLIAADIDGDGRDELVVENSEEIQALDWSGGTFSVKWRHPTDEGPYGAAGMIAYDFDGDGAAEVVDQYPGAWAIYDGRSGAVLSLMPLQTTSGGAGDVSPVIADIDNDCRTEIIIAETSDNWDEFRVTAYEWADPDVLPARAAWNQYMTHVTNVNDDGTIPRLEEPPWLRRKGWLAQEKRREQRSIPEAGDDLRICEGRTATLDASASQVGTCGAEVEYRWLYSATVACAWSWSPTCDVAPGATTVYTLETRCFAAPACAAGITSDTVTVAVYPDVVPADLGNTLQAVKSGLDGVALSWGGVPAAATYTVNRGTAKGVWPTPALRPGLAGTTTTFADLTPPPELYFYRVAGASCSGVEGP